MTRKNLTNFIPPRASQFENSEDFFSHIANSREFCQQRGYHKVSQDKKDPLICYECDLWFGKDDEVKYQVENPFDN